MAKGILFGTLTGALVFAFYLGYDPLPLVLLLIVAGAVVTFFHTRSGKGISLAGTEGKKRTSCIPDTSFDDIGGQDRAKQELKEALDFLIHRTQIDSYGIRPIKGILLTGPPGTGKTLMAKAAAHYTDSVFVSASGSEFVEMYVGVGAQRIRQLFREARRRAKKSGKTSGVVFIDEIDAIGGRREGGTQHREYDQTLNQLLTEMDGITSDQDVRILVIAATNRKELLDSALLRPGRFDRHIEVDLPDKRARKQILQLHTRNKPLDDRVDLEKIASETFGFSGAQLESLTNEAAIYALRDGEKTIGPQHFSAAIDKVMMGEKTDKKASTEERERVAIHELGHAIVAEVVHPGSVSQVSLSPRGQALGYVRQHPGEDRYLYTREHIEGRIMVCLAGTAAEQEFYGNRSTGARNDFEQAHRYIRMLIQTGLSDLGIVDPELVSKEQMREEGMRILKEIEERTSSILSRYRPVMEQSLEILLKEEVLSGEEFRRLLKAQSLTEARV
ncbi:MAG: AAA family ATPase [Planifilum sp.]